MPFFLAFNIIPIVPVIFEFKLEARFRAFESSNITVLLGISNDKAKVLASPASILALRILKQFLSLTLLILIHSSTSFPNSL